MVIALKPRSLRGNRKHSGWYERRLQEAARAQGASVLSKPLYARIIWFELRREREDVDADNIPKRILDALKGLVFEDDDAIVRCLAIKTLADASSEFEMNAVQIPSGRVLATLQEMLGTEPNVLYVEIGPVTDPTVIFGLVR
jgi:Holliday junction resolvase RusA-like endonuclease